MPQDRACLYRDADLIAKPVLAGALAVQATYQDGLLLRSIRHSIYCAASKRYGLGRDGQPYPCFKMAVERVWGTGGPRHECSGIRRETRWCAECPQLSIEEMEWVDSMMSGMPEAIILSFD